MMLLEILTVMFVAWTFTLVAFLLGVRVGRQQTLIMHSPEETRVVHTSPNEEKKKKKNKDDFPEVVTYKKPWEREADAKSSG